MESWEDSRRDKHSAVVFHNSNEDVRMAAHGNDFVCLSDDDRLKHIDKLLKPKYTAKDIGNTWIQRFRREKAFVDESFIQSWDRSNWTVLGH